MKHNNTSRSTLERTALAELIKASRAVFMEREDSILQELGIPPATHRSGESERIKQ